MKNFQKKNKKDKMTLFKKVPITKYNHNKEIKYLFLYDKKLNNKIEYIKSENNDYTFSENCVSIILQTMILIVVFKIIIR